MTTEKRPFLISSKDTGKIWSEPVLFGEDLLINPKKWEKEAFTVGDFWTNKRWNNNLCRRPVY